MRNFEERKEEIFARSNAIRMIRKKRVRFLSVTAAFAASFILITVLSVAALRKLPQKGDPISMDEAPGGHYGIDETPSTGEDKKTGDPTTSENDGPVPGTPSPATPTPVTPTPATSTPESLDSTVIDEPPSGELLLIRANAKGELIFYRVAITPDVVWSDRLLDDLTDGVRVSDGMKTLQALFKGCHGKEILQYPVAAADRVIWLYADGSEEELWVYRFELSFATGAVSVYEHDTPIGTVLLSAEEMQGILDAINQE